jgi:hypothetical protein
VVEFGSSQFFAILITQAIYLIIQPSNTIVPIPFHYLHL